ncbi:uncharacterized protein PAC_10052 [Phialocephala subalpina]|uniref:Mid2 domain-containing protein n=1 Tax=Phialocephala subalpina TaxID=576137 RepID=A0A1L7X569_9HELO|nr:uncharacterized protein PAC_10052 [Phialocephala subalpina]
MAPISYLLLAICCILLSLSVATDYHGVTQQLSHRQALPPQYPASNHISNHTSELRENVSPFNGSELVQLKCPNISSCYFDLRPNTSYGYGANSPSLNVLATARATPSTVSLPDSASTNASETGSASSDGTPGSTPSSYSGSSSGLSTGAKAGIGVGVALGVILIAAAAGFFLLRRRKTKSAVNGNAGSVPPAYGVEEVKYPQNEQYGQANYPPQTPAQQYHEVSSDATYEMPAGEARHELR